MKSFKQYITEKLEDIPVDAYGKYDEIKGLYNPRSGQEIFNLWQKSKDKTLRFVIFFKEKMVCVWDAYDANHADIATAFGYHAIAGRDWQWGLVMMDRKTKEPYVEFGGKENEIKPLLYKYAHGFKQLEYDFGASVTGYS